MDKFAMKENLLEKLINALMEMGGPKEEMAEEMPEMMGGDKVKEMPEMGEKKPMAAKMTIMSLGKKKDDEDEMEC